MIEMGPVGTNITLSEQVGNVIIKMTASRLWFKKTKTFGFDNALLKKLAASDFYLTISRAGKEIVSVGKDMVEMPVSRNVITIHKPSILFPTEMAQPDSITFDRPKMQLSFRQGASEETWDLAGK